MEDITNVPYTESCGISFKYYRTVKDVFPGREIEVVRWISLKTEGL